MILLRATDNGKITLLVLLDLSAAFDTVDHSILLTRMKKRLGITSTALNWFQSYLSNRSQLVCINDQTSDAASLDYGLPQGSCVGPALFPIYTLPLGDVIREHDVDYQFYADDSQLYLSVDPTQEAVDAGIAKLENCVDDVRGWKGDNCLKLNDSKTEFIVIGSKQQLEKVKISHIRVGASNIEPSSDIRNLGAMFDTSLTMEKQITSMSKAACLSLRNIGSIRKYLTKDAAETLIHSFVTSRIDRDNSLLNGVPNVQLNRLQRLQNMAARIVTRTKQSEHITPVLAGLHWLPVEQRVTFKLCLIVFKCLHGQAPSYLTDLIEVYSPERSGLRSADKGLLQEHRSKTLWGDRSFAIGASTLWNSLPEELRLCDDIEIFKSELKTHLYSKAFEQ